MLIGEKIQSVRDYTKEAKDALKNGDALLCTLRVGVAMGVITTIETTSSITRQFLEGKLAELKEIAIACRGLMKC